jgi:hypothetical protein
LEATGLSLAAESVERSTTGNPRGNNYQSLKLQGVTHSYQSEDGDGFKLGPVELSFRPAELVF